MTRHLARAAGGIVVALALTAPLVACRDDSPAARRDRLLAGAARHVTRTLVSGVDRARSALTAVDAALDAAGPDRARRFERLEELRLRAGVDGLYRDDAGSGGVWAGTPVEPVDLPALPPWERSFRTGDVVFHAGPFLRALVVQRIDARGGVAQATVLLTAPGGPLDGTVEERLAAKEGVADVRILPPQKDAPPPPEGVLRAAVRGAGDTADLMTVEVLSPGDAALEDRARETSHRRAGIAALLAALAALAAAAIAIRRRIASPAARGFAIAGLALLGRAVLSALDLPGRFPEVAPAFRALDFGLPGFLGWLANPGDFLLTAAALLAVAVGLARAAGAAPVPARPLHRAASGAAGVALTVVTTALWLALVEAAALHGRTDYFAPGTLLPPIPRTLMLAGLATATAAAFLFCRAGLRLATEAMPRLSPAATVALAAGLGAALGVVAGAIAGGPFPLWAPILVPAAAGALARPSPAGVGTGAASRVLLLSALSTALLFPVLWIGVADAARSDAKEVVAGLAAREAGVAARLLADLEPLARDPHLVRSLSRVAEGAPAPDGLAIHAWQRLPFGRGGDEGAVVVFDAHGRRLDRFGLDVPPFDRLPAATGRPAVEDLVVESGVGEPTAVRSTVGRVRVRGADGRPVGTVVAIVPDELALLLSGLSTSLTAGDDPHEGATLPLALVSGGRVVASTDPAIPRSQPPVPFDPAALSEPKWLDHRGPDGSEWLAVPAGERGTLLARRAPAGGETLLFALARLSIVAVGLGAAIAVLIALAGIRTFRPRLQAKILGSYFAISVLPVLVLGWANWRDAKGRSEAEFAARQEALVRVARRDLETLGSLLYQQPNLGGWAEEHGYDLSLYRDGVLHASSLEGLVKAELLPSHLPPAAYRETELEGRDFTRRDEGFAGRTVRVAYAPVRDETGAAIGTVAVPLRYDTARAEREASRTGSVLLAAYLLTLVVVVVIGILTARNLARPLDRLAQGTKRVAAGETDLAIEGEGQDELGSLITAFNRMTGELKDVRSKAARAERETAWRGMARQVAHEIKNPLTPMKLMLQQLRATAKSDPAGAAESVEEVAKIVLEQIEALSRIASDFSAFARFPQRTLVDVNVNLLVSSVCALYAAGDAAGSSVDAELADELPPVRWDADELRRVFVNVVANAVQSLDEAKGRVHVVVRSSPAKVPGSGKDGCLVTVTDDGVGIPPENRARLFEPEFSTKSSGTGLGLAIVKRILTDLGGEIAIESEQGRGTVVSIWLPRSDPQAPPPHATPYPFAASSPALPHPPASSAPT